MWGKIEILLTSIASCHLTLHLGGLTDVAQLIRDICKQKQNHKVQRIQRASFAMGVEKSRYEDLWDQKKSQAVIVKHWFYFIVFKQLKSCPENLWSGIKFLDI